MKLYSKPGAKSYQHLFKITLFVTIIFIMNSKYMNAQINVIGEKSFTQSNHADYFIPNEISNNNIYSHTDNKDEPRLRSLAFMPDSLTSDDTAGALSFSSADSLYAQPKQQLLPDKISFMENFLWGENGLVRTIGIEPPLSAPVRENEIKIRRTMLIAHQIGGFTTLALMLAAAYYGQRTIDANGNRSLGRTHSSLIGLTIASYTATGLLAVLSPPPLIRGHEGGTTGIHKTLAWIHLIGMIVTPILANNIAERKFFNMDKAHIHQIAGYITTAVFTASMLVITF